LSAAAIFEGVICSSETMRVHPDAAGEYYTLKKDLAAKYKFNSEANTEAKTLFIESIRAKAQSW